MVAPQPEASLKRPSAGDSSFHTHRKGALAKPGREGRRALESPALGDRRGIGDGRATLPVVAVDDCLPRAPKLVNQLQQQYHYHYHLV